jgi:Skp family chaperone for outer membrane proteins
MRTVSEYLAEAREYDQKARKTSNPEIKKLYADLAAAFRNLAEARKRAVEKGAIPSATPR